MSKKVKSLLVLSLAGLMSACSNGSNSASAPANNATDTAARAPASAQFKAAHSGNFEITSIGGDTPSDVVSRDDLSGRIADFPGLVQATDTFDMISAGDTHTYEYDSTNHILRLHGGGSSLEITDRGTTVTADAVDAGDKGQTQVSKKEGPTSIPCTLYREEAKQEGKGDVKPEPSQAQAPKGEQAAPAKGEQAAPAKGEQVAPAKGEQAAAPAKGEQAAPAKGEQATAPAKGEQAAAPAKGEQAAPAKGEQATAPAEKGQDQAQEQKQEIQSPETVMVRCTEELTSKDQGQDQKQSQEKPEVRSQSFFLMLNLTPVVETKQEQKGEVKPIANG